MKLDTQNLSLFERLGGKDAVNAAVDVFYDKITKDDRVNFFFDQTNMTLQRAKQKAFLTMAFGGPNNYTGRTMREAHKKSVDRGLNETHFNIIVEHLAGTLKELGVNDNDISEVANIASSVKNDVLNK